MTLPHARPDALSSPRRTLQDAPGEAMAFLHRYGRVWRIGAALLWKHNVTAMSAALSFRTIFAMVPALVLAFLILKSVGVLEDSKQALRSVLRASGFSQIALVQSSDTAPADDSGAAPSTDGQVINIADEIEQLVARVEAKLTVGRLGPIGFVLLIYTATTLLSSMEQSLNRIFGVARSRRLTRRIPLYWSVMTLGPVLVVAASYIGQRATRVLEHVSGVSWVLASTGEWAVPIIGYLILFFGLYRLLPNVDVGWRAALGGALCTTPTWLIAKWLFALYLQEIVATGNLYGALGLVPIFLVWLNLSWLIFMYGAEVTYVLGNLNNLDSLEKAERPTLGPRDLLAAMVAIAQSYNEGRGPVSFDEIKDKVKLPDEPVRWLLGQLTSVGAVCSVTGNGPPAYVPARPVEKISVLEVLRIGPSDGSPDAGRYDDEIIATLARFQQRSQAALGTTTIGELIRTEA